MEDVFKFKNLAHNFQNADTLNRSNVNSVKYGTEAITSLGAKIWKISPNDCKELTSLSTFKLKIKNWETDKCSCRLCKKKHLSSWFYLTRHCYVRSIFAKHHFCCSSCMFVCCCCLLLLLSLLLLLLLLLS